MIRVAIIEDNRLVREVLSEMLNELPDIEVVHAATGFGREAVINVSPSVVLLDIGLQDTDWLLVAETIQGDIPGAHVVVMDLLPVHEETADFVNAGVAGFILKDATFDDFVGTLRSVAAGHRVLPPTMARTLFSQIARVAAERGAEVEEAVHMTPREIEVIALIASGMNNKQIAQRMSIGAETVKSHVRNVMEKLALHSRLEIAAYAHQKED